jgi:hypothetical protein
MPECDSRKYEFFTPEWKASTIANEERIRTVGVEFVKKYMPKCLRKIKKAWDEREEWKGKPIMEGKRRNIIEQRRGIKIRV